MSSDQLQPRPESIYGFLITPDGLGQRKGYRPLEDRIPLVPNSTSTPITGRLWTAIIQSARLRMASSGNTKFMGGGLLVRRLYSVGVLADTSTSPFQGT